MGNPSWRRVAAIVALWTSVMAAVGHVAGCYGRNCEGDAIAFGGVDGEGHMIDVDTWESTAIDADWIPFFKQRAIFFEMRGLGDRQPAVIVPYISAEKNPVREGGNWTIGSGNLAEHSGSAPGRITIKNNTCADYYIRLVVSTSPRPPPALPPSGSTATADGGS